MHKRVRELVSWAEGIGFVCEGLDGNGHYKVVHPNGPYRIPATPGDWRNELNCKAEMRRIAGVAHEGPQSGRYRRGMGKAKPVPHLSSVADADRSSLLATLRGRHRRACDAIKEAQADGISFRTSRARALLAELLAAEGEFSELGEQPPLRTFRIDPSK